MKQINNFDVYSVNCSHCGDTFEGRMFHPAVWLGSAKYCDRCPGLKLFGDIDDTGPAKCGCGGTFDSTSLKCPGCRSSIKDSEKQIAAQLYLVQPAEDEDHPTAEEIDVWYKARLAEKFLTGKTLFVQLDSAVSFDGETEEWRTYKRFEF